MNSLSVSRLATILILALCAIPTPAWAQYFGKNKITYEKFDWQTYESPHFDVHYYSGIEPFLEDIVSYAESAYLKISKELDHEVKLRIPLIVYKTHGEFEQTNITLSELPESVGAFAEPVQYRMVLPIDLPPDKLYNLIAHELTHIFQYSMFFEGYLGRALRSRPPTWLMEGMASYLADDEDSLDAMAIRDAVVNNILPPVQALNVVTFLTYRYGHAIFDYIEQEHGKEGMRSFLFEFKKVLLTGNVGKAIKESFGYDLEEFDRRFNRYLRKKYFPVLLEKKSPDEYGTEIGFKRPGVFTFSPTISPSGELVAVLAAPKMELDLVVLSAEDGKRVKNLTKGWTNRYTHLVADTFEGKRDLSWSPTTDQIAVFARRENKWPLLIFNALKGNLIHDIEVPGIVQMSSPAFSPDGSRVAFEGNRNGTVDIFEIDLQTRDVRNVTRDDYFDANPWYGSDGKSLLYNRRIGEHWKIFSVDLSDASKKTQLTFGSFSDIQPSYSSNGDTIYFSSDRGPYGVFNIHSLDLATGDIAQYTDVVGGCFTPQEMAERDGEKYIVFQAFFEGSFRLYRMPLRAPELHIEAAERLLASNEAEPFEPDLRLRVDEDKKNPYKARWDIEAPSISVGIADDGTILSRGAIQFSDLLGNQRFLIAANTVSDFASYQAVYTNLKHRYNWGAQVFDARDFFYVVNNSGAVDRRTEQSSTGANIFFEYPVSRYYRFGTSAGILDQSATFPFQTSTGVQFDSFDDTLATVSVSLTGDTARYQRFGPFQGKRFQIGVNYGSQLSGDFDGDILEYRMDFRAYKQLTRRSLIAWRLSTIYNAGERQQTYSFGGLNQLRGFDYREFNGSRIAWSNLEFRFPLADEINFPWLRLAQIRGFIFLDVGTAWYKDDLWFDTNTGIIRQDCPVPSPVCPVSGEPISYSFWDSDNDQFQDGRASYGWGFQFFFLGGLQFNWVWANRLDYSEYRFNFDPLIFNYEGPFDADTSGVRSDFYITFDF